MLMSAKYRMEANYAIKYYNKKEYTLAHIHTYSTYNIEAIQAVYIRQCPYNTNVPVHIY